MRHPFYKVLLSHFKDVSIESTSSLHNPYLEVLLVKGRHQLVTRDAIYSFDDKYLNFMETFKQLDWSKIDGKDVLVLGLGLGSVILILEKHFKKKFDYTAIEIDPEICRLCSTYTLNEIDSFVEVIPTEAMQFLNSGSIKYDMVIMDVFQSAIIPKKFQSLDFLRLLESKLKSNSSVLLYNRMNITLQDREENITFKSLAKTVFPSSDYLKIKDNLVFINNTDLLKD